MRAEEAALMAANIFGIGFLVFDVSRSVIRQNWRRLPQPIAIILVYLAGVFLLGQGPRIAISQQTGIVISTYSLGLALTSGLLAQLITRATTTLLWLTVNAEAEKATRGLTATSQQSERP